jgi:hypothetical protein
MPGTYTYSGDPNVSPKDTVRFLCQDTDVVTAGAARLSDEEITWLLTQQSNVFLAAAQCCDQIANYFARITNTQIGPLKIERSQMVENYQLAAKNLRNTAARWANGSPVFYPNNDPAYQNTNSGYGGPQHIFKIGMDDYPGLSIFWPPSDPATFRFVT